MKPLYCFVLLLLHSYTYAQIVDIPDANFKDALVNSNCVDTNNDSYGDINVDTNSDGEIQVSEALAITNLNLPTGYGIYSLIGIESFINLDTLSCRANNLESLDLQGLSNLQHLECNENQLTNLNVQGLSNLNYLLCDNNHLTDLNVQGLVNLSHLYCNYTHLTDLNVQGLVNLQFLGCIGNQLTTLNVQGLNNLQTLVCGENLLTTLNVQGLVNLQVLGCAWNQLTTLNIQGLSNLKALYCNENQLTTLSLEGLSQVDEFDCHNNLLISLYIKNGSDENYLNFENNPDLEYICCDEGQLSMVQAMATGWDLTECEVTSSCSLVGTSHEWIPDSFTLYPNPTTDIFTIKNLNEAFIGDQISLMTLEGKIVFSVNISTVNPEINISDLSGGVYLLNLKNKSDNLLYHYKLVKT